ncbi:hypothetical protein BV898_13680 [Hypsibius exemplaris]|uniref:Uncharacterized protein n=1 Tax=Hypsibius exemplaris TaxID=2072580 RepID=A0A1W0WA28_HYPEX|nr:hypothetical protein BV898_13680 [Hypsibius exemplaris]
MPRRGRSKTSKGESAEFKDSGSKRNQSRHGKSDNKSGASGGSTVSAPNNAKLGAAPSVQDGADRAAATRKKSRGGSKRRLREKLYKEMINGCASCFRRMKKGRKGGKHHRKGHHGDSESGHSDHSGHSGHSDHSVHSGHSGGDKKKKKKKWPWQKEKKSKSGSKGRDKHAGGDAAKAAVVNSAASSSSVASVGEHGDNRSGGSGHSVGKRSKHSSRSSLKSRSRGGAVSTASSRDRMNVKFNESVRVQEIPHKDAKSDPGLVHEAVSSGDQMAAAQAAAHFQLAQVHHPHHPQQGGHHPQQDAHHHQAHQHPSDGSVDGSASGDLDLMGSPNSQLDMHGDDSIMELNQDEEPPGALGMCPTQSEHDLAKGLDTFSAKSTNSAVLDDISHIYDPCGRYTRKELVCMMEKLVSGINARESLKARYDEEITRLSISNEYSGDKIKMANDRLLCLVQDQENLDLALKNSSEKLNRNFLQLTRERKRVAGAVDLREDFDKYLQTQISTKTKFVQDYAQILGKLEGLVDDSSLQWIQRETMISTESEALERVHRSAEKEHCALQAEMNKHEALFATRVAQNKKLESVVQNELEKYAKKQQEILKFNEKRIRALEGCIRTMQLDREVMYGEIAENRHRLKEVVEGRINALMDKVHQYKDILKTVREEVENLLCSCQTDNVASLRISPAFSTYTKLIGALDLASLERKVNCAEKCCERAELAFKNRNNQKRDLYEIRRSHVDSQRRQMLDSEQEYFLMEPVEVPGTESKSEFKRSVDDFTSCGYKYASGAATAPTAQLDEQTQEPEKKEGGTQSAQEVRSSLKPKTEEARYSKAVEDFITAGLTGNVADAEKTITMNETDHLLQLQQSLKLDEKPGMRRRSMLQSLSASPKNVAILGIRYPSSFFTDSNIALVNASFESGASLNTKPFGPHKSLQDLQNWWRNQKSKDSIDYPAHLEQVRRARQSLMQADLLLNVAEEPARRNANTSDQFTSTMGTQREVSVSQQRPEHHFEPAKHEETPIDLVESPRLTPRPSLASAEKVEKEKGKSTLEGATKTENPVTDLPYVTLDVEQHPDKTEECLQKLIDDSVYNMTWATKVLYKYRCIEQSKHELEELSSDAGSCSSSRRTKEFRNNYSEPILPSQEHAVAELDVGSSSASILASPRTPRDEGNNELLQQESTSDGISRSSHDLYESSAHAFWNRPGLPLPLSARSSLSGSFAPRPVWHAESLLRNLLSHGNSITGYRNSPSSSSLPENQLQSASLNAKFDRFFRPDSEDIHLAASQDPDFWTDMIVAPSPGGSRDEPNYTAQVVDFLQKQSAKTATLLSAQLSRLSEYLAVQTRPETSNIRLDKLGYVYFPLAPLHVTEPTSIFGKSDASPYDGYNTRFINLYWLHYVRLFGGRAGGTFSKKRMIEKTCQGMLGCDNVASVRLQGHELTPEVVRRMADDSTCAQLWPQKTPVDFDGIKVLIVLPMKAGATITADSLREGLCQLQSAAQTSDGEICILIR